MHIVFEKQIHPKVPFFYRNYWQNDDNNISDLILNSGQSMLQLFRK